MRLVDLTSQRFGRLTVTGPAQPRRKSRYWVCACLCGRTVEASTKDLNSGNTRSCGCSRQGINAIHKQSGAALYRTWQNMRERCGNPNSSMYHLYGGRGISVYPAWHTFQVFFDWAVASGYEKGLTIERRNPNKGYEPDNCTWIPRDQQVHNRRCTIWLTDGRAVKTLSAWAKEYGMLYRTARYRWISGHPSTQHLRKVEKSEQT